MLTVSFNVLFLAAACSLGVNTGQDCKVEDADAGYVFDLSPLARHTWNNKDDFFSLQPVTPKGQTQYMYRLKVKVLSFLLTKYCKTHTHVLSGNPVLEGPLLLTKYCESHIHTCILSGHHVRWTVRNFYNYCFL